MWDIPIESPEELSDVIEVSFLELDKVKETETSDLKTLWAIFLATQKEQVLDMLSEINPTLNKAVEKLKYDSADEQVRMEYNQRQLARMGYYSDLANSRDEGIKEGIKEGLKEGLKEGRSEERKNMIIALLSQGVPE